MPQAPTHIFPSAKFLTLKPHRGRIEIRFQLPEGKLLMVSIPATELRNVSRDIARTKLPASDAEIRKHDET